MRERGRVGACPKCGAAIAAGEVARDGLIHSRGRAAGGPFYTLACHECGEALAAERVSSDAFRMSRKQDLAIGGVVLRALSSFIAAPARRGPARGAPSEPRSAPFRRPERAAAPAGSAEPVVSSSRFANELALLGLESPATMQDVKRRFRQLAKEFHPDRFQRASPESRQRAQDMFVRISSAYHAILAATR